MSNRNKHLAIAVIALIAGAAGFWLASQREPAMPPPALVASKAGPEVRPAFALKDVAGKLRSSDELTGQAVIFNFWATWCAPCRREIPLLNALQAEYASRGLQVVGIAVDSQENVAAYQKELALQYLSLQGELEAVEVGKKFGLDLYGLPVSVFTDKQGRIVAVHMGELTREVAEEHLAKVL